MSRTDSASRLIPAERERVFAALVDADALVTWLPPDGMTGRFERFDPRPGGSYRLVLTYDEGLQASGKTTSNSDVVEARFVEISAPERVVQEVDFVSDDPAFAGTMTMTWELSLDSNGTRVVVRADDVPTGISPTDHAAGLESSLANLAAFVEHSATTSQTPAGHGFASRTAHCHGPGTGTASGEPPASTRSATASRY